MPHKQTPFEIEFFQLAGFWLCCRRTQLCPEEYPNRQCIDLVGPLIGELDYGAELWLLCREEKEKSLAKNSLVVIRNEDAERFTTFLNKNGVVFTKAGGANLPNTTFKSEQSLRFLHHSFIRLMARNPKPVQASKGDQKK